MKRQKRIGDERQNFWKSQTLTNSWGSCCSPESDMRRNTKEWFVWLVEYRADNGGWYPISPRNMLYDSRKQANAHIRREYGKEAGYRAARYVREDGQTQEKK